MDIKKSIKENLPAYQAKVNILKAIDDAASTIKSSTVIDDLTSKRTTTIRRNTNAKRTA